MSDFTTISDFLTKRLPDYLRLLEQMVGVNSHTENPEGVNASAELTASAFAPLGFESETVPSDNPSYGNHLFLSRSGSAKATVLLVSHLDTVYSREEEVRQSFSFRRSGEKIYGPGTIDIKGGTVCALMTLDALSEFSPELFANTNWKVGLNAAEEVGSEDFARHCHARAADLQPAACLVFEPGHFDGSQLKLVTSRSGRASFRIRAEGRGAHAGAQHENGANAIHQLALLIPRLEALSDYDKQLTCNVGLIRGGEVTNRVPHEAELELEVRYKDPEDFRHVQAEIYALENVSEVSSAADGFPCSVKVELLSEELPLQESEAGNVLFEIWQKAASTAGLSAVTQHRAGISDANRLARYFPTLDGLGPSGANAHCSEQSEDGTKEQEYLYLPSLVQKAAINAVAISELLKRQKS